MHRKIISSAIVVALAVAAIAAQQIDRFNDRMSAQGGITFTGDVSAATITATNALASNGASITNGSGTGITVNSSGRLQRAVYKVTIDRTAFICAALTCDVTIGVLPAKTSVLSVYGDLTTVFACSATCTSSTLSMTLGATGATAEFLASFDADAAINVRGDSDAELGTNMTRAVAVQGGLTVFASGNNMVLRLTSGTGNIGTGAATNLSTGSITFYVVTERLP